MGCNSLEGGEKRNKMYRIVKREGRDDLFLLYMFRFLIGYFWDNQCNGKISKEKRIDTANCLD